MDQARDETVSIRDHANGLVCQRNCWKNAVNSWNIVDGSLTEARHRPWLQ